MPETFEHVVCPGCGSVCDDITLQFDGDQLKKFEPVCPVGLKWFRDRLKPVPNAVEVDGERASYERAIDATADILRRAEAPLIYGLSRSATPGQRAAIALADALRGTIDTTASLCYGPSVMALQEFGEVTCTLGEIRNRADLVIFWGCNPAQSHPRHAARYCVTESSKWLPNGRASRKVVIVGQEDKVESWQLDPEGSQPDIKIAVESGRDFEMLAMLRAVFADKPVDDVPDAFRELVSLMKQCRYGVVFYGTELYDTDHGSPTNSKGSANVAALLQLVAEMNTFARFTARRMRLQGDSSGADNVLCWQTGYPFAVDFSRGFPRHNPGEFSANEILCRGETDACLVVGSETVHQFSDAAREHLQSIPTIFLDYPSTKLAIQPSISFTTAAYGLHAEGTIFRMDNVPMEVRAMKATNLPTDEKVLTDVLSQIDVNG